MLALFVSLVANPVVEALGRWRIPRAIAAALVVCAMAGVGTLAVVGLSRPAAEWIERSPEVLRAVEHELRPFRGQAKDVSDFAEQVERITTVESARAPRGVRFDQPGLLRNALDTAWRLAGGGLVMVIALYLMLLTGHGLLWRCIAWLPDLNDQRRFTQVVATVQKGMARYMTAIASINLCLGTLVGVSLYCLGMPNPALWGAMAAVVNFVPYLGSLVGILTVAAVALVTFPNGSDALYPPAAYLVLTGLEGQLITPIVLGRTFRIDPLLIFVWLLFWVWMWGVAGAIVAAPLLTLIKLLCELSPTLGPVARFLATPRRRAGSRLP
jgi:predicted PurR-regulated permease PerM